MPNILHVRDVFTRILQRADIEKSGSSGVVSETEVLGLIQLATNNLHDIIVKTNELYVARYYNLTTAPNQLRYPLPADFFNLLSIGLVDRLGPSPNTWTPLWPWKLASQNVPGNGFLYFTNGMYTIMQYRVMGAEQPGLPASIEFRPQKATQIVGIWYVPAAPQYQSLDDYLPSYFMPGWEEYLVCYAAELVSAKEQQSVGLHEQIKVNILAQISSFAPSRDSFRPETVGDTWTGQTQDQWPYGAGPYYGGGLF